VQVLLILQGLFDQTQPHARRNNRLAPSPDGTFSGRLGLVE
jgi:hypothetical protein